MMRVASDNCSRNFASVMFATLSPYLQIVGIFFPRVHFGGTPFTPEEVLLLFQES
jgi:hypothetical protein